MTKTELTDRLREAIVLNGPDVWRTNGFLQQAERTGLSEEDAQQLASEVNQEVAANGLLFHNIQARIARLALPSRVQYIEQDLNQIINAAASVKLSADFVKNRWVPTVLQRLEVASKPLRAEPVEAPVPAPSPVMPPPVQVTPAEERQERIPEPTQTVVPEPIVARSAPAVVPATAPVVPAPVVTPPVSPTRPSTAPVVPPPQVVRPTPQPTRSAPVVAPSTPSVTRQVPSPVSSSPSDVRSRPAVTSPAPPVVPPVSTRPPVQPPQRPVTRDRIPERPPVVRSFTATPARVRKGQPVTLSWAVDNLLAVTIDDLGEGLSPINRGWVKPTKTTDYTLFDANNNPLSTVRVEVIKPDRSGVYGVLFALALLAGIYWFIKSNNTETGDPEPEQKAERAPKTTTELRSAPQQTLNQEITQPTDISTDEEFDRPIQQEGEPAYPPTERPTPVTSPTHKQARDEIAASEPDPKPTTAADARQGKYEEAFGDKPYDKVELGADERGWRRARSNGRWGFVNEQDEWVIKPEFEAVTPFRGNTAAVFLNGQLLNINRQGEQIRN